MFGKVKKQEKKLLNEWLMDMLLSDELSVHVEFTYSRNGGNS